MPKIVRMDRSLCAQRVRAAIFMEFHRGIAHFSIRRVLKLWDAEIRLSVLLFFPILNKYPPGDILRAIYGKVNPAVKTMASSSQVALLVFAGILLVAGGMIGAPDGRLLALALAGLCAFPILISGSRIQRISAIIILALVVSLAIPAWRQHREDRHNKRPGLNEGMKPISQIPSTYGFCRHL
jgi:hypothetical protein